MQSMPRASSCRWSRKPGQENERQHRLIVAGAVDDLNGVDNERGDGV
jgi:hypothetical protein